MQQLFTPQLSAPGRESGPGLVVGHSTDTFTASIGLTFLKFWYTLVPFSLATCDRQTACASALWHCCNGILILSADIGTRTEFNRVQGQNLLVHCTGKKLKMWNSNVQIHYVC